MTKDSVGILVIVNMSVINHAGFGEYLDFKSCVCKKSLVDKLVEECTSVNEENKIYSETSVTSSSDCGSCTFYVVLFVVFLLLYLITIGVFYWYKRLSAKKKKKKKIVSNYI